MCGLLQPTSGRVLFNRAETKWMQKTEDRRLSTRPRYVERVDVEREPYLNHLQAILLGVMLAVPLGFMTGAFLLLPQQVLGQFGGLTYQIYDLLPWAHAHNALRSVLTYGTD